MQIAHHAMRLRLAEISDSEKIESLTQIMNLALKCIPTFKIIIFLLIFLFWIVETEWHGIVATSGVIEAISGLMLETSNTKIRVCIFFFLLIYLILFFKLFLLYRRYADLLIS